MTSSSFSFNRFWRLLRRDFFEHQREHRSTALAFFISLALFNILILTMSRYFSGGQVKTPADKVATATAIFIPFAFSIGALIRLSGLFSNFNTKQARISFFMVPASNSEKFLVRFLQSTLLPWLIMALMIPVTDVALWLLSNALWFDYDSFTLVLLEGIPTSLKGIMRIGVEAQDIYIHPLYNLTLLFTSLWAFATNYVIGAVVFRRFPFILTTVALFALSILLSSVLSLLAIYLAPTTNLFEALKEYFDTHTYLYITIYFLHFQFWTNVLWISLGHFWAYRSFTRANAISQRTIGL